MNNFLVLAHPDESSFQGSLARSMEEGLREKQQKACLVNLYEEDFPPLLPLDEIRRGTSTDSLVLQHQRDLQQADRLMLFYPDWWGLPPAILKGWLDRVLSPDVAYRWQGEDFLEKEWVPLLTGKQVDIFVTADGELNHSWLQELWEERIFSPCGARVNLSILDRLRERDFSEREQWLKDRLNNY